MMKPLNQLEKELYKEDPGLKEMVEEGLEELRISELLKAARKAAGMTQKQVAEKMHVNRAYISQLEGYPQNVTLQTLIKYSRAVGGHVALTIGQ